MFINIGKKLICIKCFDGFDAGHHLSNNLHNIKIDRHYYIYGVNISYIDGVDCYIVYGRNNRVDNDNFAYYIPIDCFFNHFMTLAELRENRINKILN